MPIVHHCVVEVYWQCFRVSVRYLLWNAAVTSGWVSRWVGIFQFPRERKGTVVAVGDLILRHNPSLSKKDKGCTSAPSMVDETFANM